MSIRTTPNVILVLVVNVAPGGGTELQTSQFRSTIWLLPLPVKSVEPEYHTFPFVNDWIAS